MGRYWRGHGLQMLAFPGLGDERVPDLRPMRLSAMRTALCVQTCRGAGGRHADAGTSRVQIGSLSRARGRLHASRAHACTEAGARMVAPVATRLDVQRRARGWWRQWQTPTAETA